MNSPQFKHSSATLDTRQRNTYIAFSDTQFYGEE